MGSGRRGGWGGPKGGRALRCARASSGAWPARGRPACLPPRARARVPPPPKPTPWPGLAWQPRCAALCTLSDEQRGVVRKRLGRLGVHLSRHTGGRRCWTRGVSTRHVRAGPQTRKTPLCSLVRPPPPVLPLAGRASSRRARARARRGWSAARPATSAAASLRRAGGLHDGGQRVGRVQGGWRARTQR